jgi:peptidoglycan/LPS O-acetylase OafA/YrhL
LVPRVVAGDQSWWINAHAANTTLGMVGRDAALLFNSSLLDSPLWSLRWEVTFSLLLPLYVWIAVTWRGGSWLKILAALLLVGIGSKTGHASLLYLPVFALGVVLAAKRGRIAAAMTSLGTGIWWGIAVAAALLMSVDSMFVRAPEWITRPLRSAAAGLIVVIFLGCRSAAAFACHRSIQWLGRISFSLYLVHEPIVVTADRLLPGANVLEILVIAVPISLLVAAAFHRLLERPSLAVSRWMGRLEDRPIQFWSPELIDERPA